MSQQASVIVIVCQFALYGGVLIALVRFAAARREQTRVLRQIVATFEAWRLSQTQQSAPTPGAQSREGAP